jgi:hypothetical protein
MSTGCSVRSDLWSDPPHRGADHAPWEDISEGGLLHMLVVASMTPWAHTDSAPAVKVAQKCSSLHSPCGRGQASLTQPQLLKPRRSAVPRPDTPCWQSSWEQLVDLTLPRQQPLPEAAATAHQVVSRKYRLISVPSFVCWGAMQAHCCRSQLSPWLLVRLEDHWVVPQGHPSPGWSGSAYHCDSQDPGLWLCFQEIWVTILTHPCLSITKLIAYKWTYVTKWR